ncbi:MAG: ABC transporter permease [Spirochaetes bacterium]|nr:ABC transporter permease [Spirochaetota bacterium]
MISTVTLAWRNVRRNKRRTALTFTAITVGIAAFLLSTTIIGGIDETSLRNFINTDTAHIRIMTPAYFTERSDKPLTNFIDNYSAIVSALSSNGIAACPRIKYNASVIKDSQELFANVTGIDPERDRNVFTLLRSVVSNTALPPVQAVEQFTAGTNRCLIGLRLASTLGVSPGDEITVSTRTRYGANNADTYVIAGMIFCDNPEYDAFGIILPLQSAAALADTGDAASEIAVAAHSRSADDIEKVLYALRPLLPNTVTAFSWREQLADVLLFFTLRQAGQKIILALLLIMAIAGVTNTMLMAVFERTKEIGTLAAMGMKQIHIMRLFLVEGIIIGVIGSFFAIIVTAGPVLYIRFAGIPLFGTDTLANMPVSSRLYGYLQAWYYPAAFLIGIIVSAAATIYPSYKAASLNIAAVLRGK